MPGARHVLPGATRRVSSTRASPFAWRLTGPSARMPRKCRPTNFRQVRGSAQGNTTSRLLTAPLATAQAGGADGLEALVGEDELLVARAARRRWARRRPVRSTQIEDLAADFVQRAAALAGSGRRRRPCRRPCAGRSPGWRRS